LPIDFETTQNAFYVMIRKMQSCLLASLVANLSFKVTELVYWAVFFSTLLLSTTAYFMAREHKKALLATHKTE